MEGVVAESTQQMLRPGKCVDLYYPDPETAEKQCFRTSVNTKFVQQFANLGAGVSIFTIPPNNGVQDIVITMRLPDLTSANTGLAVCRGWGYALIKQISYRVGGSSQFFVTGDQMLQAALKNCPNASARDDLFALGGSQLVGTDLASANNFAYVWLQLPFTTPTSSGKMPPLPGDLLTQQIQITCELNPLSSIFSQNGVGPSSIPAALALAQFQVQQVMLHNQGDALARRVDMTTHSLSYPVEFVQQKLTIPLANTAGTQTTSLTGFRSGEVKAIEIWLTKGSDVGAVNNPLKWYAPKDVVMLYAGDQYARFDGFSGSLWNLVNSRQTPRVAGSTLAFGGGAYTSTPENYSWVELPFAQTYNPETAHSMYVSGKEILNGIVQLQLTTPSAAADWTLNVSYIYNAVLVFSQGSADFAF
jgi:hypothetical protein